MTDLERAVVHTLRISDKSAERLLPDIQRNIEAARMELIRSGCSADVVENGGALVEDCIIAFCVMRMGEESDRVWYEDSFRQQQENLRKSNA